MTYLVVDAIRWADLKRMDAAAETPAQAKEAAEAMAMKYACAVYVLGIVGEVQGTVDPRWSKVFGWDTEGAAP